GGAAKRSLGALDSRPFDGRPVLDSTYRHGGHPVHPAADDPDGGRSYPAADVYADALRHALHLWQGALRPRPLLVDEQRLDDRPAGGLQPPQTAPGSRARLTTRQNGMDHDERFPKKVLFRRHVTPGPGPG